MTTVLQQQQPGSFRGFPFLVNSETKEGGKKTASHEFVNSDKRFTEEFGVFPPKFSLQIIVHGDIQNRLEFERILNIPGLGTLVHPVYGAVEVKSTTFSVSSSQTSLGEFRFSVNFETSENNVTAAPVGITNAAVTKVAEDARTVLDAALEEAYAEPDIPDTLDSAASKADSIYNKVFSSVSSVTGAVQEKVSTFTRIVNENKAKVFTIVQKANTVKQSVTDMYTSALKIVNTPSELFLAWESLLDFGALENSINTITVPRLNKETNRSVLNEHTRVTGLINLFEAASYVDYKTDQELKKIQSLLDSQYKSQIESYDNLVQDGVTPLAMNADVRQKVAELRVKTRKVLNEKSQNIWRVVEITPKTSSMLLTTFRYYGDLDNFDFIKDLNPDVNSSNFKKPIQAVSG